MKFDVYNKKGEKVGSVDAPKNVFEVTVDSTLVHEAVVSQQANSRAVLATTKDRSEVRGGGRKPWRQKGTGRARHGSRRSPIWVGGGITFGPSKLRNFVKKMNRKSRRKALFMTLSDKAQDKAIVVVDDLSIDEPKTKLIDAALKALPLQGKRTLIVVDPKNESVRRATQNIPNTQTIAPNSLNVVDVIKAGTIVVGKSELETLINHFA